MIPLSLGFLVFCLAAGEPATSVEGADPIRRVGTFAPIVVRVEGTPLERVQLSVSVLDREGAPVRGLGQADFLVKENGAPQVLVDFGRELDRQDRPLSVVFLVDRSGSIGKQMSKWREACAALASALRSIDEVRLATFTSEVIILQDFTRDAGLLAGVVEDLRQSGGGTRIFQSVGQTLHDLRDRPGRKVIFLLTDGLDNDRPGVWSTATDPYLTNLVRQAVSSQVTIVTILPGPTGRPYLAAQDLAVQTGGWWLYPTDDLAGLVQKLGERLLESYFLAYDSSHPLTQRRRRQLEVTLAGAGSGAGSSFGLGKRGFQVRTVGGLYGEIPLLEILAADLEAGEEVERVRAVVALGLLADPRASHSLVKALRDDSSKVRSAAAHELGRRGEVDAVGPLARLLKDRVPAVRESVRAALRQMLEKEGDPRLQVRILDALESDEQIKPPRLTNERSGNTP